MAAQPRITTAVRHIVADCLFLLAAMVLSVAPYVGRLGFYSDDWSLIGWSRVSSDQSLPGLVRFLYSSPMVQMRPVQVAYQATQYWLFDSHPLGYHLVQSQGRLVR